MTPYRLHYAPDNASLCVRLALLGAGVPFQTVLVDRGSPAQDSAAYRVINPNGLIPTLETTDGPIFETGAILLWIADRHGVGLVPRPEHPDRGRVLAWLFWMSNTLHPALRILFYPERHVSGDTGPLVQRTRERVADMLGLLDQEAPALRPWLGGPAYPVLDCYLGPMLRWLALYAGKGWFDLARWPNLLQIARRMDEWVETSEARKAEGLGPTPFSSPRLPKPPEGSAL